MELSEVINVLDGAEVMALNRDFQEFNSAIIAAISVIRGQMRTTRERAARTGKCPMCEDCPDGCPIQAPRDPRNLPKQNVPLTLEELRERNGKPIWVCGLPGREVKWQSGWRILEENRVPMRSNSDTVLSHWTADYGHTWIAYDYEPEETTE